MWRALLRKLENSIDTYKLICEQMEIHATKMSISIKLIVNPIPK